MTTLLPPTKDNPYPSWTGQGLNPYTTPPVVANQNGIMQSTSSITAKDNTVAAGIDNKVATTFPVPAYGSDVKDANGNVVGQAKFDPNTGKPLTDPNATKPDPNGGNAPGAGAAGTITTPDGANYTMSQPSGFTYTLPTPPTGSKYIYGADGHPYLQDATGKITTDPVAETEFQKNVESNKTTTEFNTMIDTYKTGLDAANVALLDSIKQSAALQTQKMTTLNALTLGGKTVAGYRTGASEYTPEIEMGILKNEQEQGLSRLAEIDTNMKVAIAQAVSAKTDKDFELATKTFDTIKSLQKQKEDTIQQVYKNFADNLKLLDDQKKAVDAAANVTHDNAVKDLATAAPALVKAFDTLNPKDQTAYLEAISKKTGLDTSVILGEMEKSRLATENTRSEINNRNKTNNELTVGEKKKAQDDDIASAILDFQKQIKEKNWAGINPQAYDYYKAQILKLYGAAAVLDFDKAIKDAKISIDTGTGV